MKIPFWPDAKIHNIELGLSRVLQLLERLGNPHLKLPPAIHIAGTNGKGSTLAFLRAIFEESGLKIHTYTSPHLVNFNERILLAGKEISDDFLNEILTECKKAAEIFPQIQVTFFEGTTVATFLAFSRVPADLLLLETGMGGRLDATNVLPEVLCSVITPISFDHEEFLGNTLAKIAYEKAGIIKKNCPVVIGKQVEEALQVIEDQAFKKRAILTKPNLPLTTYHLPLIGNFQKENAALAIAVVKAQKKFSVSEEQIKNGLKKAKWPARLQKIPHDDFDLYLDGSHNLQGAETVAEFLKKQILKQVQDDIHIGTVANPHFLPFLNSTSPCKSRVQIFQKVDLRHGHICHPELVSGSKKQKKVILIFSMLKDKNCVGFLTKIKDEIDELIALTIPDEPRSLKDFEIVKIAEKIGIKSQTASNFDEAFKKIKSDERPLVLISGSLYLAGKFLENNAHLLTI
ncbi:MAG: hypothetical protein A2887_04530 [Alphaproteobacteria bacterium RIFCSPLOWO2_01_FULL_40_26]|nr:MAG: hypothetical protein A3D15_05755 [Alphaproteobacteria bacterium RIFCSPHIGHO2_02_FULL_40_34]OFW95205.1 MAG: hypothetical protein A2887_04530 [Alphaproteobacteria bacterium RIFCSPLOWO2_01_FULL_40_26]OFX09960.1 MAG: hypothetical protein A3H30_02685 [Alphaproteobacteria bacterium RIFCSPLOWO2_02_FULL_40_19]OFX12346.1 MAG: hypothetical protein A3G22_03635 [Alphaproteobacteria bacterium RIFCSPLOWO2_12_FULL_40_11]